MKIKLIPIVLLLFSFCGCEMGNTKFPNSNFDIVYQKLISNDEVVAFYSETTQITQTFKPDSRLTQPYYFKKGYLASIQKAGWPARPVDYIGQMAVYFESSEIVKCGSDLVTEEIHPYGNEISFLNNNSIKIFDPSTCSLLNDLFSLKNIELISSDDSFFIDSYAVDKKSPFLIVSLGVGSNNKLMRINNDTREVLDYKRIGMNPSISPDEKKVAYFGLNGIHTMNIDGTNDQIIVMDNTRYDSGSFLDKYNYPKPIWSSDGSKLVFHMCNSEVMVCESYEDYDVFIIDLTTGKIEKIGTSGLNPSWVIQESP
jgi:hypothetical protein